MTSSRCDLCLSGKNWVKNDQLPAAPATTSSSEGRDMELKGKDRETYEQPLNSILQSGSEFDTSLNGKIQN